MIDAFDVLKITSLNSIASTFYAAKSLVQQAITELKKTDGTHLYLPGVSSTFGVSTGNYIDSAGNQAAVLDSPVGLTLDALGVLGTTVVVNGSFTTDANWTKGSGWTISDGQAVLTAGGGILEQVMGSVNVGASYIASINTNLLLQLRVGGVNIGYFTPQNGTILCFIKAITGTLIELVPNGTQTGYVSKISVKELSGIHASQSTTANKPVLKQTNGNYNWLFDSTDSLQLTFPAGYESATIIEATAAGQVTVTGQNITGAYNIGPSLSTNGRIILRDTPTQRQLYLYQNLAKRLAGL
jgi:hypothetical protein